MIDLVAPEDEREAAAYNRLERLRDPSHTHALSTEELRGTLKGCGLSGIRTASRDVEVETERWLALASTATARAQAIREDLMHEVLGSTSTGMRPFLDDGVLMFTQRWVIDGSLRWASKPISTAYEGSITLVIEAGVGAGRYNCLL
ncbi:MAG: hypothetical protein M3M97_06130 [Actinomycetota bacterium]|nr:hypothetical protein [Actinomycetota bacterium]